MVIIHETDEAIHLCHRPGFRKLNRYPIFGDWMTDEGDLGFWRGSTSSVQSLAQPLPTSQEQGSHVTGAGFRFLRIRSDYVCTTPRMASQRYWTGCSSDVETLLTHCFDSILKASSQMLWTSFLGGLLLPLQWPDTIKHGCSKRQCICADLAAELELQL